MPTTLARHQRRIAMAASFPFVVMVVVEVDVHGRIYAETSVVIVVKF
jgi:hypothetical protein